jgi:sporulation protein YlmC with PRC-barrel domain
MRRTSTGASIHDVMRLDLGSPVRCADGSAGELADIVIDPRTRQVTYLVVEPHDRHDLARLVPADRARAAPEQDGSIVLDCTVAEIGELEPLRRMAYLRVGEQPEEDPDSDVGIEDISVAPSYQSFGFDSLGGGIEPIGYDPHVALSYDRIPKGNVEVRRESAVTSSEGRHLGHVLGVVVDPQDQIAQLVLEHGHLWGKREIAIPLAAVARIQTDEVMLGLSSDQVGELKPLPKHRRT